MSFEASHRRRIEEASAMIAEILPSQTEELARADVRS